MGTALVYLLVMIAVAAVVFVCAALIFGRGEELAPLPPGHTPTRLPRERHRRRRRAGGAVPAGAARVPDVRGGLDLDRLATELDRTEDERAALRSRIDELERPRVDELTPPVAPENGVQPPSPTPIAHAVAQAVAKPVAASRRRTARSKRPPRELLARETEDAGER